jgi:ankyrin repeat protein
MLIIASAHSNVTINARATNGWTAFVYAAYYEHQEVAKVLIAAGAHLYTTLLEKNWLDCDKYEAFENSIQKLFACARSLSSEWDDPSAKSTPPRERLHTLNALIKERELRLDYIDPQGNTLLHYVVLSGDRAAISLVLYFMVKHNQLDTLEHYDKHLDMTPIEMAVIKGGAPLLYPFFNLRLLKKN